MEELNTPIFAQAKVEYTAQLIDILYPHIFDGVKSIYDESKLLYPNRKIPILLIFRELLEKVPIWNSEIIDSECSRIINNSSCDWIDDLITAVFISHTKILTSIGPNQSFQKINITIPKSSTFIHKSYINTARELWKNPYLFNENVPGHEFQKNNKEIEEIIKKCIENTIRNSLPIKDILKEHLEGETDSILNQKELLKQMLREELSNIQPIQKNKKFNHLNKGLDDNIDISDIDHDNDNDGDDRNIGDNDSDIYNGDDIDNNDKHTLIHKSEGLPLIKQSEDLPLIQKEKDLPQNMEEELKEETKSVDDLQGKLKEYVDKEKNLMDELNNLEESQITDNFTSSGDPSDEKVSKECSDIVVNDITIPVDVPGENTIDNKEDISKPVVEIKYDNVDINKEEENKVDNDKLKKLMTNMQAPIEEVNVVKSDQMINTPDINASQPASQSASQNTFSFDNLYPNMNQSSENPSVPTTSVSNPSEPTKSVNDPLVKPLNIIEENKPIDNSIQEPKSPRKEMVAVKNEDDIDETSSLANFFDDMKKIVEDKGIKVEQNNDKMFTLFEDANEVEK
jgi:hypothetical protein